MGSFTYGLLLLTLMECDKVARADLKGHHFVHFIAHDRTVQSQSIDGKLGLKYFGDGGDLVFHSILTGEYVRRLQAGGLSDVKGRPIKLDDRTVFHCFIVADIVGKLDEWTYTWQHTADGRGRLYQPQSGFRGSIELIGWDALLGDARARNQAFFDRAGISGKSYFSPD